MPAKRLKSISRLPRLIYLKLIRINDSPLRISIGFAIGVFTGIMPGAGPLAALGLALIFRVNRAASLIGSLLTNTWLSIITLLLAVKTGAALTGLKEEEAFRGWANFLGHFQPSSIFKLSALKIIFPIIAGYVILGFGAGILAYVICIVILKLIRKKFSVLRLNVNNKKDR